MIDPAPPGYEPQSRRVLALKVALLVVWAMASFGLCFFAHDLQFVVGGWPFHYWMAGQGAVLVFIGILAVYAWAMNRREPDEEAEGAPDA